MEPQNSEIIRFLTLVSHKLESSEPFKLVLAKSRGLRTDLRNVHVKPIMIKDKYHLSCTFKFSTRDEVKNYNPTLFMDELKHLLLADFFNADVFTENQVIQFLQNKKNNAKLIIKNQNNTLNTTLTHDHQKPKYVDEQASYMQLLGLVSEKGQVFEKGKNKFKQINKYIEIISHLLKNEDPKDEFQIADMGSGKAYLSFALYDYLTTQKKWKVHLTGYEIRPDLVQKCNDIAQKVGYDNLIFIQQSIDEAELESKDMVIALHACDIATDMAIAKGIEANAKYIVLAPCCHKQVRKAMVPKNELSPILSHGILMERQAELITDGIRSLLMESKGYKTQVFEFISSEHTGKNIMITGVKAGTNNKALEQVKEIKDHFGIEFHYLEKILK